MGPDPCIKTVIALFARHLSQAEVEQNWIDYYLHILENNLKPLIAEAIVPSVGTHTIDELTLSAIPPKVIDDCMRLSQPIVYRIGRRLFTFLIHTGMLERGYLPERKTVLLEAIEQAPEQLSAQTTLRDSCCAFIRYLWEKHTLLTDAVRAYYHHVQAFSAWKGLHSALGAVVSGDIAAYLLHLEQKRGYSAASRATILSTLRAFFTFFTASGVIPSDPTTGFRVKKQKKHPPNALSEAELTTIFQAAYFNFRQYEDLPAGGGKQACSRWLAARDWAIVSLLITTGIRVKEIAALHTDSIDFSRRLITVDGKGAGRYAVRQRILPVSEPIALAATETYLQLRPQSLFPHLFLGARLEPLQHTGFANALKQTIRRAGIQKPVTMTVLRKSFSSLCAQKGIDPLLLKQIMGHASLATTMKYYLSIQQQQLKEVWETNNPLHYFTEKEWKSWIL